jgi:hypothetical protein
VIAAPFGEPGKVGVDHVEPISELIYKGPPYVVIYTELPSDEHAIELYRVYVPGLVILTQLSPLFLLIYIVPFSIPYSIEPFDEDANACHAAVTPFIMLNGAGIDEDDAVNPSQPQLFLVNMT